VTAPWDRRSADEQGRVSDLTMSTWGPSVASAAPFWSRWAAALGIEPASLRDREALTRLVPARARDLLDDAPGGAGAVLRPDEQQVKAYGSTAVLTSVLRGIRQHGADGKREALLREFQPLQLHRAGELLVASTRSDLDRMHRAGARAAAVLGLDDRDVVLSAVPSGPTLASSGTFHLAAGASLPALHAWGAAGGTAVEGSPEPVHAGLAEVVDLARLHPATVVLVRPEDAVDLASGLADDRVDLRSLRRIVTVGPPPDDESRAAIAGAFATAGASVDVRAVWGPAAGRVLWAECAAGSGLHTYPDLEHLELVDPFTGQPTHDDGDLTLTTIGWHGTVLLRFQTGAWVDPLETGPCPSCKRTVPRLVGLPVPDAWDLAVTGDAGRPVTVDLRGVAVVLSTLPGVGAWRCELLGPTGRVHSDRLVLEVAGQLSSDQQLRLRERIGAASGLTPEVRVTADAAAVQRAIDEAGSVFVDLR
jgi:hypothetical protein